MLYILSQIIGWISTVFRAAGMLVKDAMLVKWLVSIGNAGWLISGILTENVPLIASNAICLVIMVIEVIKKRKNKMDPRHPELALARVKELTAQYERVEKDLKKTKVSSKLAELEREGILVVQELNLVAPRLHDLLIQTSRTRRGEIAREAAMEFVETPKEPVEKPEEKPEEVVVSKTETPTEPENKPEKVVKKKAKTTKKTDKK